MYQSRHHPHEHRETEKGQKLSLKYSVDMLNTTRKLVSVKRDRLSLCFKTTTVFVFFFVLATVGYAVHGVF